MAQRSRGVRVGAVFALHLPRGRRWEAGVRRPADQRVVLADDGCAVGGGGGFRGRSAGCSDGGGGDVWVARGEAFHKEVEDHFDVEFALPIFSLADYVFGDVCCRSGWRAERVEGIGLSRFFFDAPE